MFEKVNPSHPDKIADRIGGAIVDLAYKQEENPKIAVEVLIGHGKCSVIIESSKEIPRDDIVDAIARINEDVTDIDIMQIPQDKHLAENQKGKIRCGDNGIFKGVRVSEEEKKLTQIVKKLYEENKTDGKYILDESRNLLIACQSNVKSEELKEKLKKYGIENVIVNPLGDWTGGINVDTGATNRKLGSDMGRAVTGGGINCKDCSKADVSINVYLHMLANTTHQSEIQCSCAIGDENVIINGKEIPYETIVKEAKAYIDEIGGFEKMAEWGLIR